MRGFKSAKLALIVGIVCLALPPENSPAAGHQAITCSFLNGQQVKFDAPARLGDLPNVDFDYPVKVTHFSFHDGNLSLVAMDGGDASRVRIVILAQLRKGQKTYDGQILVDSGGHELQYDNGPVSCTAGPAGK